MAPDLTSNVFYIPGIGPEILKLISYSTHFFLQQFQHINDKT